jgi:hypothetical protein
VNISTLRQFQNIPFCTVSGYVTAVYDNHWWLGYVMEKFEETGGIYIRLLRSQGSSAYFTYPVQLDELTLPVNHILSLSYILN